MTDTDYLFDKVSEKKNLTKVRWSLYHTSDNTKYQTLQRIQSIPTLSRVLFYRGTDESRDRFKHFMESELRGKVGSFFDITRITCRVSAPHYQKLWSKKESNIGEISCILLFWQGFRKIVLSFKTVKWESFMTFRKFPTFVLQRM